MKLIHTLLAFGVFGLLAAAATTSQANLAPTLAGGACFFGILARISQASAQHEELIRARRSVDEPPTVGA